MRLRRAIPSLGALATFEAAARLGGFTRAARELGVTQAAVSRQIRRLEEDLRVPLFVRANRRVTLTPAGGVLAMAVDQSFERIGDAIEVIRQPLMTDALTIAATLSFSHFWLLPRLSAFRAAHPRVTLRLISEDGEIDLRDGTADVVLRYGQAPFRDGESVAAIVDEVFAVCSPDLHDRFAAEIRSGGLLDLPLIGTDVPDPSWLSWPRWSAMAGFGRMPDVSVLRFNHYNDAVYAAINGQGVALGWRLLLEGPLAEGTLLRVGGWSVTPPGAYHAVVPLRREQSAAVTAFAAWIAREFEAATSRQRAQE